MNYYHQTQRLLTLYDGSHTNYLRHFFSQLQQLRGLLSIPLVNAITIIQKETVKDEYDLISKSITFQPYMKNIKIEDIRNVIVFLIRKEFRRIVKTTPYIEKNETDVAFLELDKKSTLGMNAKYLETLIETCFYITHVYYIHFKKERIQPQSWEMYHDFINNSTLTVSVKFTYDMIRCLIESS